MVTVRTVRRGQILRKTVNPKTLSISAEKWNLIFRENTDNDLKDPSGLRHFGLQGRIPKLVSPKDCFP